MVRGILLVLLKHVMLSWDDYYMGIALLCSKRSKDPSTQVGACIVNPKSKHVISIGYNGFPVIPNKVNDLVFPWSKHAECELDTKYMFVCHAELNAVLNKNQEDVFGCTIFTTLFPCNECAKLLVQSGIARVVYLSDSKGESVSARASRKMLSLAGVEVEEFQSDKSCIVVRMKDDHDRIPVCD